MLITSLRNTVTTSQTASDYRAWFLKNYHGFPRSLRASLVFQTEMVTHSSILAWKIPWMEDPGRLQSMGVAKSWT